MLYFVVILLSLLVIGLSWLSAPFFILLSIIAIYGGKKASEQVYNLKLSDSGLVDLVSQNNEFISAKISRFSFYNSFFLCLHLQNNPRDLSSLTKYKNISDFFIVIYRDAVSEEQYRLLARLINTGRD